MNIFADKTILTVTRLTALLRGVLEENFEHVWVKGEISNLSSPSSGHLYFTLKDSGAQLRAVMFKSAAKNLKFHLKDGMDMIVRGRISVYDQRGEYQLLCEYLEPAGVGALQMAFVQLKERLGKEGLFDEGRKLSIPAFPRKVGVITSPTGAAIHDILNILKRRCTSLHVLLYPVRVQGEGAALEIARAVDEMNDLALVDVLIVGRGGGSLEDLWAFNEEVVARAVHRSRIPIISAVGHETDWTICDFVADLRAPTPSAAAEIVITSSEELQARVEALKYRLRVLIERRLNNFESCLKVLRRALQDPSVTLGHLGQRVDDLSERLNLSFSNSVLRRKELLVRLHTSLTHRNPASQADIQRQRIKLLLAEAERLLAARLESIKQQVGSNAARLEVLSPLNTIGRGYSITTLVADGRVVNDAEQLSVGDRVKVRFNRGIAECSVETVELA